MEEMLATAGEYRVSFDTHVDLKLGDCLLMDG